MDLQLTGERTLPGIPDENYWFQRHVAAYRLAAQRGAGRRVLDAGCGEGYGARMIAANGARVVGVDSVAEVVAHAGRAYPQVAFLRAGLTALPFADASLDTVVSFQVIEHLHDVPAWLAETARVLRPGGELLCATPNRLTFTPEGDTPLNPFHVREFAPAELVAELDPWFRVHTLLGVHHGRRIRLVERLASAPLPELMAAGTAEDWPRWLRACVHRVRPEDFDIRAEGVAASLDLIALATRRASV